MTTVASRSADEATRGTRPLAAKAAAARWVWRSLTYLKVQPFRHRPVELVETGLTA